MPGAEVSALNCAVPCTAMGPKSRGDQASRGVRADDQQAGGAEVARRQQWVGRSLESHDRRHPEDPA